MHSIIQCPVCRSSLQLTDKNWRCENNHSFDIARQGYCNLLLANQKKSANPGDDRQMLLSRQAFLQHGFYQPVSDAINSLISQHCESAENIIDVGCGEGYYLANLQTQLFKQANCYGTDISKEALKLAARSYPETASQEFHWFVAAARNLPFLDDSVELALNIFAPADWAELNRVLKPGGKVLLAVAGREHLAGLKQHIYKEVRPHQPERFLEKSAPWFELIDQHDCLFELTLDNNEHIRQLLQMTPYYWQTSEKRRQSVENLQSLTTPVNFQLYLIQTLK